ncbi:N-6 DNA methylase [Rhodocytophaga aerolata]|uniref:site-specific DNA-methyltransferase (adenine-specific) n=1 Tax=Rhodocytophaga aerolata TaxID=455078 RepID=A0ABT8RG81_9BACT|nr:N-6 DNA methylase [Rhodocytophaga aerolata]MDO1450354.1 N-6 DNA methylase [Rhodocytophaga aerolata]
MTLHEAIVEVLEDLGHPLSTRHIADEVNRRRLYQRGDGEPVPSSQISARVRNYPNLFLIENNRIRLVKESVNKKSTDYEKMFTQLADFSRNLGYSVRNLVPAFIFAARISHLNNQPISVDSKLSYIEITHLLNDINISKVFKGSLSSIINEIKNLDENTSQKIIDIINNYDLSIKSVNQDNFGPYFENFIYSFQNPNLAKSQYSSPKVLKILIAKLIDNFDGVVYDPALGLGGFFTAILNELQNKNQLGTANNLELIGQEIDETVRACAIMNLHMHGYFQAEIFGGNSIDEPAIGYNAADLIVSDLPFGNRIFDNQIVSKGRNSSLYGSQKVEVIFLEMIISRLANRGKAIIVIPDGILFSKDTNSKRVRELLVKQDMLEAVISLPAGIKLPFTGVKTSLLIFRNGKNMNHEKVLFINSDSNENKYQGLSKKEFGRETINFDTIQKIYFEFREEENISRVVEKDEIITNDFDLSVQKYVSKAGKIIRNLKIHGENIKQVKETVKKNYRKIVEASTSIPFVRINDLSESVIDCQLAINKLTFNPKQKGILIDNDAILISTRGSKLKPTYFHYKGIPIIVERGIIAFSINDKIIIPEHLIYELYSDLVVEQLKSIRGGGRIIPALFRSDFFELYIRVPDIQEQYRRLLDKKELYLEVKKEEEELLKVEDYIQKLEYNSLSNFKHNFMQKLERVSSGIKVIENYLEDKVYDKTSINWFEPVTKPLNETYHLKIDSLQQVFNRLKLNINDAINSLEIEIRWLEKENRPLNRKVINLYQFFKNEIIPLYIQKGNYKIHLTKDESLSQNFDFKSNVDKALIKDAISNLIVNAEKYGFREQRVEPYNILFEFSKVEEAGQNYVNIIYKNDGAPFPYGFTFKDLIQRGRRAGENSNTGIGGSFINTIIQKHGGIFREFKPNYESQFSPFNIQFEILLPLIIE